MEAAAAISSSAECRSHIRKELAAWIRDLPGKDKDDLLVAAVSFLPAMEEQTSAPLSPSKRPLSSYGAIPRRTAGAF